MIFKDLFENYNLERKTPLQFDEFSRCGMTEYYFLKYLKRVEALRSAVILQEDFSGINDFPNFDNEKSTICKDLISVEVGRLKSFFSTFLTDLPSFDELIHFLKIGGVRYITFHGDSGNHIPPDSEVVDGTMIYIDSDKFRSVIEHVLYETICGLHFAIVDSDPIQVDKNLSLQTLEHLCNDLQFKLWDDEEWNIEHNLSSSAAIQTWAKEEDNHYISLAIQKETIKAYENQIENIKLQYTPRKILWIYGGGRIVCQLKGHNIRTVNGELMLRSGKIINLQVNYCEDCNRYFLSKSEYDIYRAKYPDLLANFKFDGGDAGTWNRDEYSLLALNGYSVKKNGPDEDSRHTILSRLLELEILRKDQILDHLEMLIRTNGAKDHMEFAVDKWRKDQSYVRNWKQDEQSTVSLDDIKKYARNR